jgi:hypothetical protein
VKLRAIGLTLFAASIFVANLVIRGRAAEPIEIQGPSSPAGATQTDTRVQGVSGCAVSGCHNSQDAAGSPGSEYAAWVRDPHGRASETLQSTAYRAILTRLKGTAYAEEFCLKCHATPTADGSALPRDLLAEGVGCESCHGPSERWRTVHYQSAWKGLTDEQKWQQYGLYPNKDLSRRIEKCTECHVGTAEKDVNHDLIAAGHPRLTFEYTAYHHLLTRHWREPFEQTPPPANARRDFEIHAWVLGQAVTIKATVGLLAARAERANQPTHPWPEFAEYGCFACHHDLKLDDDKESWRQKRGFAGGQPGDWTWGTWVVPATEVLRRHTPALSPEPDDPFAELSTLMRKSLPAPDQIRATSKVTFDRINSWLTRIRGSEPWTAAQVRERLTAVTSFGLAQDAMHWPRDWDEATQHYLALAALYTALGNLDPPAASAQRRALFEPLREPLRFRADRVARYDSPVDFRPEQYRQALQRFRTAFEGGTAP